MELIKREQVPTETGKKLYDILVKIWSDGDFVYCNLAVLKGDRNKQKLIDYIEQHDITDPSDVNELTDCILDGVEPEFEEDA